MHISCIFVTIHLYFFLALSLTSCDNSLENVVCNLTCTTIDLEQSVAFDKEPDIAIIAQCITDGRCFESSLYSISQPNSTSTILSFIHLRKNAGTWRCSYGSTPTSVSVPCASSSRTCIFLTFKTILVRNCGRRVEIPYMGSIRHLIWPTWTLIISDYLYI